MSSHVNQSSVAMLPEMELFVAPAIQKSVERSYEVQYRSISPLGVSPFIEFNITSSKDEYLLLHETYLYVKIQTEITKLVDREKAITIDDWNKVKPVNNLLHSMFKQVELEIGGKEVTMSNSNYAYRAYLENLLGFSDDSKKSHLTAALWYPDDSIQKFFTPDDTTSRLSNQVDLYGRIHFDMTFQGKAILGGKDIKVKLITHDAAFYMRSDDSVSVKCNILDASLYTHKMKGTPQLLTSHAKALALTPAKYPINRVDLRQVSIPAGSMDAMLDNIVTGQLPRRLFMFMVPNKNLNGGKDEDPFNFQHFNASHVACYFDGVQFPTNAYQPDFKKGLYIREYFSLFQALNMDSVDTTINISREDYAEGKTIFAFNFAADLSQGSGMSGHINAIKRGSLRMHVRFAQPLTEVVTVFLYCEFDNLIEIDLERNVITDFK